MQFSKKGYKDEQFSGTTRHITTYVQTISALFQRRTPDLIPFFSILGYGMGMSGGFGDY